MKTLSSVILRILFYFQRNYFFLISFCLMNVLHLAFSVAMASGYSDRTRLSDSFLSNYEAKNAVEIEWAFWGDPWEVKVVDNIIKIYEFENPNVKIITRHVPWDHYSVAARQWFLSDSTPDVLFVPHIEPFVEKGYLLPLNSFVERDQYALDDFYPSLLALFKQNGRLYGFPRDNDTKVVFYNKEHFINSGLAFPKCGWHWDDLKKIADKLTDRNKGRYGIVHNNEWLALLLMQSFSAETDTINHARISADSEVEASEWFVQLIKDNTPSRSFNVSSKHAAALFREQRVSMMFANHAVVPGLLKERSLDWGVVCLPENRRKANKIGGAGYVISHKTKHPDAAWHFLKWISGRRGQAIFTESGAIFPARRSIAESAVFRNLKGEDHARVFVEEIQHAEPLHEFNEKYKANIRASSELVKFLLKRVKHHEDVDVSSKYYQSDAENNTEFFLL